MGVGKSESQIIDEEAIEIVKQCFPKADWTVYDLRPDTGIDHPLEIVENGKHTSRIIDLQVKGHRKLKKIEKGKYISQKLECEHLDSYLKKTRPVFLVVVDVAMRKCFWLFVHKYADTVLKDGKWREKLLDGSNAPRIMIHVPASDTLKDLKRFRHAVEDSLGYLAHRLMRKGLEYAERTFSSLDPRFDVKLDFSAAGNHYTLHAKTDVSVQMTFREGFIKSGKLDQLVGRGLPVAVGRGEIAVDGSPLLQYLFEEAAKNSGQFQVAHKREGFLILRRENADVMLIGREWLIPCVFSGGRSECRIEAATHNRMFHFATTIRSGDGTCNAFKVNLSFRHWFGRPVLDLPHFDDVQSVFVEGDELDRVKIVAEIDGQRVEFGTFRRENDMFSDVVYLVLKQAWYEV
jgi:hypothetical protein